MRLSLPKLPAVPWRALLAVLPLPMLALAASYGVYSFALLFVPEWVALAQAAAFETTYLGLAALHTLDERQRRRARLVGIGAVLTSIIYNTLAGWFHRQPALLVGATPIADLMLAVLHGAPLAWVAFLVSDLLLHRVAPPLAADAGDRAQRVRTRQSAPTPAWVALESATLDDLAPANIALDHDEAQAAHDELRGPLDEPPPAARDYTCRRCGAIGLTAAELMAHGRRFKRWGVCEPTPFVTPAAD
jgi:hypothetical protein